MIRRIVPFLAAISLLADLAPSIHAAVRRPIPAGTSNVADLSVQKTSPLNAAAGTDVSFGVTISNIGPDAAITVTLSDPLPAGMTFVSRTQNSGPAFACTDPGVGNTGTITCTIASLAVTSANFTFVAHIPPAAPPGTTYTNIATASATGSFDPNSENDSGVTSVTVPNPEADIAVVKNGPAGALPNSDVAYDITVSNTGPAAAQSFSLSDTLPGTMTFVSITQNNGPAFICTPGATVTCTIASLVAGASANFTLVGHIPSGTPAGTTFSNTATVTTTTADSNTDNNQSTNFLTVSNVDLSVAKSGPATGIAGQNITYSLTFANGGTDPAVNAQFVDNLPAGTTFVSFTPTGGNTTPSCSTPAVGQPGPISCSSASFPAAGTVSYSLIININANVPNGSTLTNTVTASTNSFDTNNANNSASSSATVTGFTDLSVTKTGPGATVAGSNISYSITVTNNGPSAATSAQLSDPLPAGTTFVSLTPTGGPAAVCSTPAVGSNGTVTCSWASLAIGATATFTLVVKTDPNATGTISNTATVSSSVGETNAGNNSATALTVLSTATDLVITKTPSSGPYGTGQSLTWTLAVTNNSGTNAANVIVSDVLPAGTTFTGSTPAGACSGTTTITCTAGTVNGFATATFTITVSLPSTPGPITNTATVSTTTTDVNPANNTATSTVTVIPAANIPAVSTLALLLLCLVLAVAGAFVQRH